MAGTIVVAANNTGGKKWILWKRAFYWGSIVVGEQRERGNVCRSGSFSVCLQLSGQSWRRRHLLWFLFSTFEYLFICALFFVLFLALLVQLYLTLVCLQYGEGRRGEACAVLRCNCSSCEAPIHSQSQAASRLQPPALPTPIHSCTEYHVFVPVLREPILRQLLRQNDFEQNSGD